MSLNLLAGCGGGVSPAYRQSGNRVTTFFPPALARRAAGLPLSRGLGWFSAAVLDATTPLLYVSDDYADQVTIYDSMSRNGPPVGQITKGVSAPGGLAVDNLGNLYVSNTSAATVTMYLPGTTSPSTTYSKGLTFPGSVAVGTDGTVYAGNIVGASFGPGGVVEYPKGSTNPSLTITDSNFYGVVALALDKNNNLYITYNNPSGQGQINEYAPGQTKGKNLGITTGYAGGIAFDGAGDLVTADQTLPAIEVFPPGATKPSRTFGTAGDPDPIAFNKFRTNLFVGDGQQNEVLVYNFKKGTQGNFFNNGVDVPAGVALSPPAP